MQTRKKILSIALALMLVFSLSVSAFAAPAETPGVTVQITEGNVNPDGTYSGNGGPSYQVTLPEGGFVRFDDDYDDPIDPWGLNSWVDYGALKQTFYLPWDVEDPLDGVPSVLDAVLLALLRNGWYPITGWDSYNIPNGGFISDVDPGFTSAMPYTFYEGPNGETMAVARGFGWNIAYSLDGGQTFITSDVYLSNVPAVDGMIIQFDLSYYEMPFDSGYTWPTIPPWN